MNPEHAQHWVNYNLMTNGFEILQIRSQAGRDPDPILLTH